MVDTFPCPNCGKRIPDDVEACPHCKFYFGPAAVAPPVEDNDRPFDDAVEEPASPSADSRDTEETDAWGGRMDNVAVKAYDYELEKELIQTEGPRWEKLDEFLGVDTSKEVKIIRDAPPAGHIRRLLAWLLDLVIIELPALAFLAFVKYGDRPLALGLNLSEEEFTFLCAASALVNYLVLYVPYTMGIHKRGGQTFGKRFFGIEVVRLDGTYIDGRQAFVRALVGLLGPIGLITALFEMQRRALHDLIAGTRVVRS